MNFNLFSVITSYLNINGEVDMRWSYAFILWISIFILCCSQDNSKDISYDMGLDQAIEKGASLLWISAHPDDESLISPILVKACKGLGNQCRLVVMTKGGGGECTLEQGCVPDVKTVRTKEMEEAAKAYNAELSLYDFTNFPLKEGLLGFYSIDIIREKWEAEGDPKSIIYDEIESFRPDIIITFDPSNGFTSNPEHQLVAMYTLESINDIVIKHNNKPPSPKLVYAILNKYPFSPFPLDSLDASEAFDPHQECPNLGNSCFEIARSIVVIHKSQGVSVGLTLSLFGDIVDYLYLHKFFTLVQSFSH